MKVLGLDLGVGSVGWALIEVAEDKTPLYIYGMGSRIVNLSTDDSKGFSGKGETVCSQRTVNRTMRKGLDRYQMRRAQLLERLSKLGMLDPDNRLMNLSPMETWQLRADAATDGHKLSLPEIGRVLLHINQRRGYRHAKSDVSDSKQTEYVASVNSRYAQLRELGMTVGQYFAREMKASEQTTPEGKHFYTYRIKERVLPRKAYEEEFDRILEVQSAFYPDILTTDEAAILKNIIFYLRPLRSCKHLVSLCEFEKSIFTTNEGREVSGGPKVAPRTSPLAQVCRLYEAINNICLANAANARRCWHVGDDRHMSLFGDDTINSRDIRLLQPEWQFTEEERQRVFDHLNTHEKLTATDLFKILGLKKTDGFKPDTSLRKGITGNTTYVRLFKALDGLLDKQKIEEMLYFDLKTTETVNRQTGEVIQIIAPDYINQPLYKLWHIIYSISNREELAKALEKNYGITDSEIVDRLFAIDFVKDGYANKSAKFIRRILVALMQGYMYSEACTIANVNHSDSLTTAENERRHLLDRLSNLPKGALRQPVVEKILNQMINVVNALMEKYGRIDEIRVELARELKQSKDERIQATSAIASNEKENKRIAEIITEHGLRASRRNIQKYRLFKESGEKCMYCGQTVKMAEFLGGEGVEIEHIIPRSLLFDDSFSNKACSCRKCNHEKGQLTAYDYMSGKGEEELAKYEERVDELFRSKAITKTKRDRLLTPMNKIPEDFLERDLRQTQYISKKAREILMDVCRNVYASSGNVTSFLRHIWGYDNVLHSVNFERYVAADLVEDVEFEHAGQKHTEKRIAGWSKRLDHRHHAIDALVVALTRQGYIQRLNNLSQQRDQMYRDVQAQSTEFKDKFHLLEKWAETRGHFSFGDVCEAIDKIAVSFKAGKKLTTPGKRAVYRKGKRKVVQTGISVPRGALHEGTIYGKINTLDKNRDIKYALNNPHLIVDNNIRRQIEEALAITDSDVKKAKKYLSANPVYDRNQQPVSAVDCYKQEFVVRYKMSTIKYKDIDSIVDKAVREAVRKRFESVGNDDKKFQQSLSEAPITIGRNVSIPVKVVRCYTGLKSENVAVVRRDASGNALGYAKTGSNHHVAFYTTPECKIVTVMTSFWTAVKRHALGLPAVVTDPQAAWNHISQLDDTLDVAEVASTLPDYNWQFSQSMSMNEMFILGMSDDEYADAIRLHDFKTLTAHLYRVQNISMNDYLFRLHTDTTSDRSTEGKTAKMYIRVLSYGALSEFTPRKVRVNCLGEIDFGI